MAIRNVISTLLQDGTEALGPDTLVWHYPANDILNGSLLTVESNHFCVLKSRGAIVNVFETGQFTIQTPDRPLIGSFVKEFYGGQSPWQYEAIYITRAKLVVRAEGLALSREMAELLYDVDYYVDIATPQDAVTLVQRMPFRGHSLTTQALNAYAGPVVEQAINQVAQVTAFERINEKINDLTASVGQHLARFLVGYGVRLEAVKVLVKPRDERMRTLIALKAFGLSELDAIRYYTAMLMADRGIVSAPNMAIGAPFNIGSQITPMPHDGPSLNALAGQGAPPQPIAPIPPGRVKE